MDMKKIKYRLESLLLLLHVQGNSVICVAVVMHVPMHLWWRYIKLFLNRKIYLTFQGVRLA